MNKEPVVTLLIRESLLAIVKNSIGSNVFRNFYAKVNGEKRDILEDGTKSCAIFTSSVLLQLELIEMPHVTVGGVVRDMEASGWTKIDEPKIGCILVWEPIEFDEELQIDIQHTGFYIGDDQAISNSYEERSPQIHHWTYDDKRKITAMYWHDKLDD